ncbi:hypothetical protein AKJ08_1643 [Vulgatibacter incomptus]|uniref:Uncharacterized protein n=1 Tax=Vulgatibacter incomptus TaxID=1391653 RepID=A0A0K1PCY1_9BACT|nr:hypothetical protein AKJ08_1643 [Vulgatibacter incomptus]
MVGHHRRATARPGASDEDSREIRASPPLRKFGIGRVPRPGGAVQLRRARRPTPCPGIPFVRHSAVGPAHESPESNGFRTRNSSPFTVGTPAPVPDRTATGAGREPRRSLDA